MNWLQQSLVDEIRLRMSCLSWSQARLAKEVGISQKHLSQLMLGRVQGTLEMWASLLDATKGGA